jgi:hypothetical protein
MSLDDIVNVSVSLSSAGLSKPGFGTIMCAANVPSAVSTLWGPDVVRTYTSAAAMLGATEGFVASDRAYKMVAQCFSQSPKPTRVKVGRLATNHTQIIELTPTNLTVGFVYTGKVQGVTWTYAVTTGTAVAISTGIAAAINALSVTGCTAAAVSTTHLTVTATAGLTLDLTEMSTALTVADVTADPGTAGTATNLTAIVAADNDWYMLLIDSSSEAINKAAAGWCESTYKIFVGHSADSAILTSASTDIASDLLALSYFRSSPWYNQDISANIAPAIAANRSTATPGSDTWALKNLSGVRPSDALTATQITNLKAKNCNFYQTIGTEGRTYGGQVSGGEYIDVVRFLDWLRATMQVNIYNTLIAFEKVPNTSEGISYIQGAVEVTLKQGISNGGFKPNSTSSSVPDESDTTSFDATTRTLSNVTFTGILANAIHAVTVTGTVSN